MLCVVILTFNEEGHLDRCLESLSPLNAFLIVVDSFSSDSTALIASRHNARFIQNRFINQAQQFNFALTELPKDVKWVLRIDADEYLTPKLAHSINEALASPSEVMGYGLKRRMTFAGNLIKHGGLFPVEIVRLFRFGHGVCEERWMDEHIVVDGPVGQLEGELIDDNLKSLTWWIQKHNLYSNREAVEVLKLKYAPNTANKTMAGSAGLKRLIKERIYSKLPVVPKVLAYFLYRYVIRLGFLDGKEGFAFHFLQGFWYRYLVEAKVQEVERCVQTNKVELHEAIERVLEIRL
ncbi:MAG: glycosyl transferase [Limnobacter sp. CACIAM 66H1]|uniref:glycosyltransferase family 2 protein n=1 Tax=Limnobacter sp. CACIAM 66H1 TaxID=1813033 RepID=UPI0007A86052|nr:glycosyltransferase family 2 protein [Limnobacter sp. CACIAM 66H1]KYP10057.1 MAG: glycosyl transferase [Limnobacter sp. CACIAM 66H1]